jgi:tRNA (guanine37-N1)-methyltransferase
VAPLPTGTFGFDVLTLFPAVLAGLRQESLIGKAIESGGVDICLHNWRDWTTDRHHVVDDIPYGGGAGMVLKPDVVVRCLRDVRAQRPAGVRTVLLSPAGTPLRQPMAEAWAQTAGLILLCGRYEGFDARIEDHVDEVVSIGDYVLNGGEVAAMVVIEAVARLLPDVIGNAASLQEESHTDGLLEHPQYTRPRDFEGATVPAELLSGHHGEIARWRRRQRLLRTLARRPDLFAAVLPTLQLDRKDRAWLAGVTTKSV